MITKVICSGCLLLAMLSSALVQVHGPRVELSLIVTDKADKSLNQLLKSNVRVFEDDVEQSILSLEPDNRPVDLGIVIDASASFRSMLSASLEAAGLIIINKRPEDEIFIERFVSSDKIDVADICNPKVQAPNQAKRNHHEQQSVQNNQTTIHLSCRQRSWTCGVVRAGD